MNNSYKQFYESDSEKRMAGSQLYPQHEIILEKLKEIDLAGKHILDLGCGGGSLLKELSSLDKTSKLYGGDISHNQLRLAFHPQVYLVECDVLALPFKKETFDLVISNELLEHISNPFKMIDEIHRIIKPKGKLILTVPNDINMFIGRIWSGDFKYAFYNYGHLNDFSSVDKLRIISRNKFNILEAIQENLHKFPLFILVWLEKVFKRTLFMQKESYKIDNCGYKKFTLSIRNRRILGKIIQLLIIKPTVHLIYFLEKKD